MSPLSLFKYAFSNSVLDMGNRIEIRVNDQTGLTGNVNGEAARLWLEKYAFTYELIVPKQFYTTMLLIMQEDMRRLFPQYLIEKEVSNRKVLALTKFKGGAALEPMDTVSSYTSSRNGFTLKNGVLNSFINNLNGQFLQHLKMPVIDKTGISGPVDLTIRANLSSVVEMNLALDKYGLKFMETTEPIEILVIKDNPNYTQL